MVHISSAVVYSFLGISVSQISLSWWEKVKACLRGPKTKADLYCLKATTISKALKTLFIHQFSHFLALMFIYCPGWELCFYSFHFLFHTGRSLVAHLLLLRFPV